MGGKVFRGRGARIKVERRSLTKSKIYGESNQRGGGGREGAKESVRRSGEPKYHKTPWRKRGSFRRETKTRGPVYSGKERRVDRPL